MCDLVQLFPENIMWIPKFVKKTALPCLKATFQAWRREASREVHTGLLPLRLLRELKTDGEGGQVCHLPKGIVAEKPDWTAFLFIKAPAESGSLAIEIADKSPSGHLRWESSVSPATLDPVIRSVGDVVVNELTHLNEEDT